jgi:BCCIP
MSNNGDNSSPSKSEMKRTFEESNNGAADEDDNGDDDNDDDDDDDDENESSDDDLILEGFMVRDPNVSDDDDDDDAEEEEEDCDEDVDSDDLDQKQKAVTTATTTTTSLGDGKSDRNSEIKTTTPTTQPSRQKTNTLNSSVQIKSKVTKKKKKKRKKRDSDEEDVDNDDVLNVDFTFCDMEEKYFHGMKSLLHSSSTLYQQEYSSQLSDLMIDNVSIGTVVSTSMEDTSEPDVFGFASVLNITTYQDMAAIQYLKQFCIQHCPKEHATELNVCLSGSTKRPAGFLIHCRMINMPMEIVSVLQEQLILDIDWAIDHADGCTDDERKAYDFGAFVRLAPCERDNNNTTSGSSSSSNGLIYKYFDDEILAGRAEFHYVVDAIPKSYSKDAKQYIDVIVLTKTGHRAALQDLRKLIHG